MHPYEVFDRTLQDIKELWESIAEDLLQLPDLAAVLEDIQEGCLCVTWFVVPSEKLKHHIKKCISFRKDILRRHNIVVFTLNEECLYQELLHVYVHIYITGRRENALRTSSMELDH